ncbi:MAG: hypothetical protein M1817_004670 [Caeruleum heppii]|nr:MAG: hypothetical protein M1817_004670 [Caeruleum heppii]
MSHQGSSSSSSPAPPCSSSTSPTLGMPQPLDPRAVALANVDLRRREKKLSLKKGTIAKKEIERQTQEELQRAAGSASRDGRPPVRPSGPTIPVPRVPTPYPTPTVEPAVRQFRPRLPSAEFTVLPPILCWDLRSWTPEPVPSLCGSPMPLTPSETPHPSSPSLRRIKIPAGAVLPIPKRSVNAQDYVGLSPTASPPWW